MSRQAPFFRPRLAFATPVLADTSGTEPGLTRDQQVKFRAEVLPHLDSAYSFARYLTRDAATAEDIVQDAFEKALRSFGAFRGENPKAWLFAIVRRSFLDSQAAARRRSHLAVTEADLGEGAATAVALAHDPDQLSPEDELLRHRETELVRGTINSLPEPFRETLVMRELEELSYKDIASLTGSPIGTVMSRLTRARKMLSEVLLPWKVSASDELKGGGF